MTDRRFLAANGQVAAAELQGQVTAKRYVEGTRHSVTTPVLDLCRTPGGPRDRQLLRGDSLRRLDVQEGHAFVQAGDGYVGYAAATALGTPITPTHIVASRATHAYTGADLKSPETMHLSFGAKLCGAGTDGAFVATDAGYVPAGHLHPLAPPLTDPAGQAEKLLGTPYLWGGNTVLGIDCSGLVTATFRACGLPAPADSDLQLAQMGTALAPDAPLIRGDLVFWKGHVGIMLDATRLIHANAHHMAVAIEPLAEASARIEAQGGGPILACKRLTPDG